MEDLSNYNDDQVRTNAPQTEADVSNSAEPAEPAKDDNTANTGNSSAAASEEGEKKMSLLAILSQSEYDGVRKNTAEKLGMSVEDLDALVARRRKPTQDAKVSLTNDVEPWPEAVDGSELLDGLVAGYEEYLTLVPHAAETMALWAVFTHAFDAAPCNPRLVFKSAEKRSGKTSALRLIADTAARPLATANISSAVIYRIIDKERPTLLIDEADTFAKGNPELTGILNSGHTRAYAFVMRSVGDDHEPKRFSTWAPMALAVIKNLADTLEDRSIMIPMHRQTNEEGKKRTRLRGNHPSGLEELGRKAARWAQDHMDELRKAEPELPDELDDRAADNWEPLFAIADAVGGDWPERARQAAIALSADTEAGSIGVELLADIQRIFDGLDMDRLPSAKIVKDLIAMSDRPWKAYSWGKDISEHQLAGLLRHYGIRPGSIHLNEELQATLGLKKATAKGYKREQFEDAFTRYLSEDTSAETGTPPETAEDPRHSVAECSTETDEELLNAKILR